MKKTTVLRKATSGTGKGIVAIAMVAMAASAPAATAVHAAGTNPPISEQAIDQAIEQLMARIKSGRKPLPVWALDTAMLAYKTWKTYRNGQKVEEVRHKVTETLKIVSEIREDVEAGREMSDREYRRTRDLLDLQSRRLADLTGRVEVIEKMQRQTDKRVDSWGRRTSEVERRIFRRGCGYLKAWRKGRCVDVTNDPN